MLPILPTKQKFRQNGIPIYSSQFRVDHLQSVSNQRKYFANISNHGKEQRANTWLRQSSNFNVTTHYSTCGSSHCFLLAGMEVTAVVHMGKSDRVLNLFYLGVVGSLAYCVWLGDALCSYKSRKLECCSTVPFLIKQAFIVLHNHRHLF